MHQEIEIKIKATRSSKTREEVKAHWETIRSLIDAIAQEPISEEAVADTKKAISSLPLETLFQEFDR